MPFGVQLLESLATDVITSALQNRELEGNVNAVLKERKILVGQLILQRFRGGRDNGPFAVQHRRYEIGERLARAGSRFGDEVTVGRHGRSDRSRHLNLARAILATTGQIGRDGTQRRHRSLAQTHRFAL